MIRKLIRLSPSTAAVSLPTSWIKKNNLSRGASLFVEEKENNIVIKAFNHKTDTSTQIEAYHLDKTMMLMAVDAAYISGYDCIKILTKSQEMITFLSKAVRFYPGMIVHEQSFDYLIYKDIAENSQADFVKTINHLYNLLISLVEDANQYVTKREWDHLDRLKKRDYNFNSYVSYCQRCLNKYGYVNLSKAGILHTYVKIMEMIADKICAEFMQIGQDKGKINSNLVDHLLSVLRKMQRTRAELIYDRLSEIEAERIKALKLKGDFSEVFQLIFDLEELELQLKI
ncbi:MAG: AbrB/MazE/SpoVT family DNA-binding domain-containing protein [Candidatus Woesearchaeota archaeon]